MNGLELFNKVREKNPSQRILFIFAADVEVPENEVCIRKPFTLKQIGRYLNTDYLGSSYLEP